MSGSDAALDKAREQAEILRKAISRDRAAIADANERLRKQSAELRHLERFIANWHALADGQPRGKRPKNPKGRDVVDKSLEIIRKLDRAVPRKELLQRLTDAGIAINGKDPEMVLGTMLYRDERIVRIKNHGYWPADQANDAAFYFPEHENVIGSTESD